MTANRILRMLCERFCKPETPRPFTVLRHRSGQHLRSLLWMEYPEAHIRIADEDYSAPTLDEFNLWIQTDDVSDMSWEKNYRDCDDIARAIRCRIFAIGHEYKTTFTLCYAEGHTSTGEYHAFCIFIDDTDKIWVLEPQSDEMILCSESTYLPDFIQL